MANSVTLAWVDGRMTKATTAVWSSLDRAALYGDGLFETVRVHAGTACDLEAHFLRFRSSAETLGFPDPRSLVARAREALNAILARAPDPDGVLRFTWSRGEGPRGFAPDPECRIRLVVHWYPLSERLNDLRRGVHAIVAHGLVAGSMARFKTCSAMIYVEAARRAREAGLEEAFLEDGHGGLSEASSANLFVVRNGEILTPPASLPLLPGITRSWVLNNAEQIATPVRESTVTLDDMLSCQEAFLTNSLGGVIPVLSVEGQTLGSGAMGKVTRALQEHLDHHWLSLPQSDPSIQGNS